MTTKTKTPARLSLSLDKLKTLSAAEAAVPRGRDCLPIASGSNKGGGGDGAGGGLIHY